MGNYRVKTIYYINNIKYQYNMFGNCDSEKNGEKDFYNKIKSNIDIIFDVGCRKESFY